MNGDKDPPSTLALFSTILSKAENDFLQSQSTISTNATIQQQQLQEARAKLFHITTQLARLNLSDESLLHSSSNDESVIQNGIKLWILILDFMNRYPDYALFKIVIEEEPSHADNDNEEAEEKISEEMSIWLLPRLLRCMILSKTTTIINATSHGNPAQQPGSQQDRARDKEILMEKGENWMKEVISDQLRLFYHREEGGLKRRRELVSVLIKLAQGMSNITWM